MTAKGLQFTLSKNTLMLEPTIPENEADRLKELESFSILDTLEEADFDNLTAIASQICGTPIALVSLLDENRQWFKSHHGLDVSETPKKYSFCGHAINSPNEIFVINDSRKDERFHDNPLVVSDPKVIFYAGIPLVTESGLPLGTLCVIDNQPRELKSEQIKSLKALSQQVVNLLYLRKKEKELEEAVKQLKVKNDDLDKFAFVAAHDLSAPLRNISALSELFMEIYHDNLDERGREFLRLIKQSSIKLRDMVDGLLEYSRNENHVREKKETIEMAVLTDYISGLFSANPSCTIRWKTSIKQLHTNRSGLHQILINLISNAIKHNDKPHSFITIDLSETNKKYKWFVKDNGPGIPKEFHEKIFEIFTALPPKKIGVDSNGIGLATVKKLVESFGGEVKIKSELGQGSTFHFTIRK